MSTRKPRAQKSRVRPISRPHTVVHTNNNWTVNHVHGGNWPWYTLKLVRCRPAADGNPRASYWLAWSAEDKRFARSSDLMHFHSHEPMFAEWLAAWLAANLLKCVAKNHVVTPSN